MNMPTSNAFIANVDALLREPLKMPREATLAGNRVIGCLGPEIPVALILGSGALPLALRGGIAPTPLADRILESAFSPNARAVTEQWLLGQLDFLDGVVFSRADDSSQRLYYYLCELQRRGLCKGPRPLLFDIARIARSTSTAHTLESHRRLAAELGADSAEISRANERIARREAVLEEVRARAQANAPLPGGLAWKIRRAASLDWRESFDDDARRWLTAAPALVKPLRIVLAGSAPPDDALHVAIEAAGGSVVAEFTEVSPVLAMRQDAGWALTRARDAGADAVIFWLIEEDEALPWEISRQMGRLREKSVPALMLSRQPWSVDDTARAQVKEFISEKVLP
jgi:hypothetical protein